MKNVNNKIGLISIFLSLNFSFAVVEAFGGTLTIDIGGTDDFGQVLARGDFNNDGHTSLVVATPNKTIFPTSSPYNYIAGAGNITVISNYSQSNTVGRRKTLSQLDALKGYPETDDSFGRSLAVGDFNRDGYDDLAVGIPGEDLGGVKDAGAVNIIFGSQYGLTTYRNQFWSAANAGGTYKKNDQFGSSLASGDFNGDSYDDLAIGVPGNQGGRVRILHGTRYGLTTWSKDYLFHQGIYTVQGIVKGLPEREDRFGAALASGNFNGDEFDDLAIGSPGESIGNIKNAGAVNIIFGSPQSLTGNNNQMWHQNINGIPGASESDDFFGHSLATGNFNGDQYDDLVVGVPGEDIGNINSAGAVNILLGNITGLTSRDSQFWSQDSNQVLGKAEQLDRFGAALATGDFNNDGFDELAIGVPGETLPASCSGFCPAPYDQGAVNVLYGSIYGIDADDNQIWHQESNNIAGKSEAFDQFGTSLITGDFDHDGRTDIAIGVPGENSLGAVNTILGSSRGLLDTGNSIIME